MHLQKLAVPEWAPTLHLTFLTIFLYGLHTGARKEELVNRQSYKKREDFRIIKRGVPLPCTPDNIANFQDGDFLQTRSECSKADRLNITRGTKKPWFRN